jgi:hypothetical protein
MVRTTKSALEERVEQLNDRLDRSLHLSSHSTGAAGRSYNLDNEERLHLNTHGASANEMDYFLDGVKAGIRLAKDPDYVGEWAENRDDIEVELL